MPWIVPTEKVAASVAQSSTLPYRGFAIRGRPATTSTYPQHPARYPGLLRYLIISLTTALLWTASTPTTSLAADAPLRRTWTVDGLSREALVYVPPQATNQATPVVFAFHGHGGSMQHAARTFSLHTRWPEAIVVYMQGLNTPGRLTDPEGKKTGWQHAPGDQGDRDLKFFDAVLARLRACLKIRWGPAARDFGGGQGGEAGASPQRAVTAEPTLATAKRSAARRVLAERARWLRCSSVTGRWRPCSLVTPRHRPLSPRTGHHGIFRQALKTDYRVDARRLYATGHSNGGGFTYLLWAERGDTFAAFAPSAAAAARTLSQLQPKPVLHLAGEKDALVKFDWQQQMITALRRRHQCGEGQPWAGEKGCTLYPSPLNAPVVTYIHPGPHTFPAAAPGLIVKFFQQHPPPSTTTP